MSRPAPCPANLDRCSLALALLLAACGGASRGGGETTGLWFAKAAPGAALPNAWLSFPFPADFRRVAGGGPDLHDFPNPSNSSLLGSYEAVAATLDGFSTNGATYFLFNGPLDPSTVPTGAGRGLDADAPIQLVDVTTGSPEYAARRPLRVTLQTRGGAYVAPNTLAVAPAWGFPLREGTTYAVLVGSAVRAADGSPLAAPPLLEVALGTGNDTGGVDAATVARIAASFAPLRAYLTAQRLDPKALVAATVFTTQHVAADLDALAAQIASRPAPPYRGDAWQTPPGGTGFSVARRFLWHRSPDLTTDYYLLQGRFTSPNYMVGEVPYTSGGHLQLTSPYREEDLRFVLSIPAAPPASGTCYPIVEYAHGTGFTPDSAGAYTFDGDGTAGRLAARGLAGISIDQPLHGQRAGGLTYNVELATFNFLNIASARSILRQSAVDTLSLTRFIRSSLRVPAAVSPTGKDLCFDPSRVGFLGHSQGGLTGALAASVSDVPTFMLSGAGGGLAITLIERKQPVDISAFMAATLAMAPGEVLDDMHPVVTLVQTLLDATDPVNYAARWLTASPPHSVLLTSGLHDAHTPYATAIALATAGGVPAVRPLVTTMTALDLRGLTPLLAPVAGNAGGATAGLLQWDDSPPGADDSHFVIFNRPEAIHAVMRFFESAAYGTGASIERDPASTDQ